MLRSSGYSNEPAETCKAGNFLTTYATVIISRTLLHCVKQKVQMGLQHDVRHQFINSLLIIYEVSRLVGAHMTSCELPNQQAQFVGENDEYQRNVIISQ